MGKMKNPMKIFIYFVLVAPILAKIIEWLFQLIGHGGLSHLSGGVWLMQLIFIEALALGIYGIMHLNKTIKIQNLILVPGIAYFLKEIYNLIFVYETFSGPVFIAIFFEPIIMLFLVSWIPYNLFFNKKIGKR